MKTLRILLVLALAWTASAATTSNDDSCDIGVVPAATLLLPYFEVDLENINGETTVFTITNVTNVDRIARITLWTDYAFPVVTFNIHLTGYDVQSISLYDVIARGVIGPAANVARGRYSKPNPASTCGELPRTLPAEQVAYIQRAFTDGTVPDLGSVPGCNNIGNEHDNAIGYATIDLVRNCSTNNPFAEQYWTEDLAFDNVLIGDSQQIDSAHNYAQGSPLVHIRAIPEGGGATNLPRTFYSRYQPSHAPKLDGRQPLPSVFAARWIAGGASGFGTSFKVWREGRRGRNVTCATHDDNVMEMKELVTFDEAENAVGDVPVSRITPITTEFTLPATSRTRITDAQTYPQLSNGAIGGWVYFNLNNDLYSGTGNSSNWVVASMRAEGRYSVDIDATPLGNGCSAPTPVSEVTTGTAIIGPRP